jgi:hypothetical protein
VRHSEVDVTEMLNRCRVERAVARISLAQKGRKWDQMKEICKEIRQDGELVHLLDQSKYTNMLEAAERMTRNIIGLFILDLEHLDFYSATIHLERIKLDSNSPASPSMLNALTNLLRQATYKMIMQGPEVARAVVAPFTRDAPPSLKAPIKNGPPQGTVSA